MRNLVLFILILFNEVVFSQLPRINSSPTYTYGKFSFVGDSAEVLVSYNVGTLADVPAQAAAVQIDLPLTTDLSTVSIQSSTFVLDTSYIGASGQAIFRLVNPNQLAAGSILTITIKYKNTKYVTLPTNFVSFVESNPKRSPFVIINSPNLSRGEVYTRAVPRLKDTTYYNATPNSLLSLGDPLVNGFNHFNVKLQSFTNYQKSTISIDPSTAVVNVARNSIRFVGVDTIVREVSYVDDTLHAFPPFDILTDNANVIIVNNGFDSVFRKTVYVNQLAAYPALDSIQFSGTNPTRTFTSRVTASASSVMVSPRSSTFIGIDTQTITRCASNVSGYCVNYRYITTYINFDFRDTAFIKEDSNLVINPLPKDPNSGRWDTIYTKQGGLIAGPDGGPYVYTPKEGFIGTDTIIRRTCDTARNPTQITCLNDTTFVNIIPVYPDDKDTTKANTPILVGDTVRTLPGTAPATVTSFDGPNDGILTPGPKGTFTYTPNPNKIGNDTFQRSVCVTFTTGNTLCDTQKYVVVTLPNENPTVRQIKPEDIANIGTPVGPMPGNTMTIRDTAKFGTTTPNPDGTTTYKSLLGVIGTDTVRREICFTPAGGTQTCSTIVHLVNIIPDYKNTQDTILPNASIVRGDTVKPIDRASLNINIKKSPRNGIAVMNPTNGLITYTPVAGYVGTDTVVREVCVTFTNGMRSCDTSLHVFIIQPNYTKDTVFTDLNDTVKVGEPIIPSPGQTDMAFTKQGGTLSPRTPSGEYIYTPPVDFIGTDTVVRERCDLVASVKVNCKFDTIFVNIAPNYPDARDTTPLDTPISIGDPVKTIPGTNPAVVSIIDQPNGGTTTINPDGTITYNPNQDKVGLDTMLRRVCVTFKTGQTDCDTQRYIVLVVPNEKPTVRFITDDSIPKIGEPIAALPGTTIRIVDTAKFGATTPNSDGTTKYTPVQNKVGTDSVRRTICMQTLPNPEMCTTVMHLVKIAPSFPDSTLLIQPGDTKTVGDSVNKLSPNQDLVTITMVKNTTNGVATINTTNGLVTYKPNFGFTGRDTFIRRVCVRFTDGSDSCDNSTYIFIIEPDFGRDTLLTYKNVPIKIEPGLVTDPASKTDTAISKRGGTLTKDPDGRYNYQPPADMLGTDTIIRTICDLFERVKVNCKNDTTFVNIAPTYPDFIDTTDNKTPITLGDTVKTLPGTQPANVSILQNPKGGTATINPTTGIVTYTPKPETVGYDTLKRLVCVTFTTRTTECDTQDYVILVTPKENPTERYITTKENPTVGDKLTPLLGSRVRVTDTARYGKTTTNPDNSTTYTPVPNKLGSDSIIRTICVITATDSSCTEVVHVIHVVPNYPDTLHRLYPNQTVKSGEPVVMLNPISNPRVTWTPPKDGSIIINPDHTFNYKSPNRFTRPDTVIRLVCIRLSNGKDTCDRSVHIFVPDTPKTTKEDSTIVINPFRSGVIINDTVYATNGTATKNPDGTITYDPKPKFVGTDTIFSVLCVYDSATRVQKCDTAIQLVNVHPRPWRDTLQVVIGESGQNDITSVKLVKINGGTVNETLIQFPLNGTVTFNSDSTVFYFRGTKEGVDSIEVRNYYTFADGTNSFVSNYIVYRVIPDFDLPNVITPNGDGVNDKFVLPPSIRRNASAPKLVIFNRWGNAVWRSIGEYKDDFAGYHFDGEILPDGVYYYILEMKPNDDKPKSGFIQIVRD